MVVLHQHLALAPVPVTQLRSDIPAAMAALVDDLLAKAPASRPNDASQVKSRLLAALPDGEAAAAQPPVTAVAQTAALAGIRARAALADAGSPTTRRPEGPPASSRRSRHSASSSSRC